MFDYKVMLPRLVLGMFVTVMLAALVGAQTTSPPVTVDNPAKPGKTPTRKNRFSGPGGIGKPGGYYPGGQGKPGGFVPGGQGEGNDPTNTPPTFFPKGVGKTKPNPKDVPKPKPGDFGGGGSSSPGGLDPLSPGAHVPGGGILPQNPRARGATGALGQGVDDVSWQNWWLLNQAHFLDLEKRYQIRLSAVEQDRDLFTGDDPGDVPRLIQSGDELVVKKTLPLLKGLLQHESFQVRIQAAIAVGRVGNMKQVSWLAPLTKDKNKSVRKAAILGLGLLQTERSLPMLKHLLRSRANPISERAYAAVAIGLVGKLDSTSFLIERLDKGRRVRQIDAAQLYALGMIPSIRARRYLDYYVSHPLRDTTLRAVALDALALHKSVDALDTILKSLRDQDVRVRRSAAAALGQVDFSSRYRKEWEELNHSLRADSTLEMSSRVLGEFESYRARLKIKLEADESKLADRKAEVVEAIKKFGLTDSDVMVRNFCQISLGELGGKEALALLLRETREATLNSTRAFAALGLALTGSKGVGPVLLKRLSRKRLNQETKAAYFLALGLVGEGDAKKMIRKRFEHTGDVALARFSAISLALLGDETAKKPLRKNLLKKSRPELKQAFGQALSILGDYGVVDEIEKNLKRHGAVAHKVQMFAALAAIQDARTLELLLRQATAKKQKSLVLAANVRAIGMVAEKGNRPILTSWFRHLNYRLRVPVLNQIALL